MTDNITTSKFDALEHFINATSAVCAQKINCCQGILEVNKIVLDIIGRRKRSKRIPISEYAALAKYGCPDAFFNYGLGDDEAEYYDSQLDNCVRTTCGYCWKDYINKTVDSLNNHPNLLIKNINKDKKE